MKTQADVVGGPVSGWVREDGAKESDDLRDGSVAGGVWKLIEDAAAEGGQPGCEAFAAMGQRGGARMEGDETDGEAGLLEEVLVLSG